MPPLHADADADADAPLAACCTAGSSTWSSITAACASGRTGARRRWPSASTACSRSPTTKSRHAHSSSSSSPSLLARRSCVCVSGVCVSGLVYGRVGRACASRAGRGAGPRRGRGSHVRARRARRRRRPQAPRPLLVHSHLRLRPPQRPREVLRVHRRVRAPIAFLLLLYTSTVYVYICTRTSMYSTRKHSRTDMLLYMYFGSAGTPPAVWPRHSSAMCTRRPTK